MDQSALVGDQIEDGRKFIERFAADGNDVQAACWVREADSDGWWFLYVVSSLIDDEGPNVAYGAVHESLRKLGGGLGILSGRIRVVGPEYPVAREVLALMKRYPNRSTIWRGESAETAAEDRIYIYPARYFDFTQPNPMTSDQVVQEIVQLMRRGPSAALPSRVVLKDGVSFNGSPFSLQSSGPDALSAQFIAENETMPRTYRVDEIASID